jgi:hypothetical protein
MMCLVCISSFGHSEPVSDASGRLCLSLDKPPGQVKPNKLLRCLVPQALHLMRTGFWRNVSEGLFHVIVNESALLRVSIKSCKLKNLLMIECY